MVYYVSKDTIRAAVDFFRERDYKKPEQIGLYFYFKATGLNKYLYTTYPKWGNIPNPQRRELMRNLYDLAGVFDITCEKGRKRTALFPFAITNQYRQSLFYNGGTEFAGLGSRISDTLDNTLVSSFIQRNNADPSQIMLSPNYLDILSNQYIQGHKISLEYLAAWFYKFWKISMPDGCNNQDFQDICVLGFLKHFHISCEEFSNFFYYGRCSISPTDHHISGPELREFLGITGDCAPDVVEERSPDFTSYNVELPMEQVSELLELRGESLTQERIIEILSADDQDLQDRAAALIAANATDADTYHDYSRDELMAMDNKDFIFSCLEMMSHHHLFNGFTLPIMESREQCALLFRHNNIHGILFRREPGITDEEFRAATQDEGGRSRYYTDTYSIGEHEYYVSSQWRGDKRDREAFLDWLFELLLTIRFETGFTTEFERNRIVFGAPGTGKSHRLNADRLRLLALHPNNFERVTFHPEYTYSQFVGSYKPVTDEKGDIRYDFVPGPFMRVLVAALKSGRTETPQPHLLLIEEINRAKVAAVFGDVFQLLDRDDSGASAYEIHATEDIKKYLISELGKATDIIRIPDNMFIWATMNSADQGVYPMDTAFKRRWNFEYIGIDENDAEVGGIVTLGRGDNARDVNWNQLRRAINETLARNYNVNEDKLLGPYFLSHRDFAYNEDGRMANPERFIQAFKSKVLMYLYEDAAKAIKHQLFDGCDSSRYSSVCTAFDEKGIDIFGQAFVDLYNSLEV